MTQAAAAAPASEAKPAAAPAPQPGTPEYDAAMIARANAATPGASTPETPATPAAAERPAWLPEKFATPEDMAKSYKELETKLGAQPAKPPAIVTPPDAAAAVQKAGLDMAALNTEFAEKGDLTPETRAKLKEAGYDDAIVNGYIEGQKALAVKYASAADEAAGGAEQLKAMMTWAHANFTAQEAKVFNEASASGDVDKLTFAVSGLKARYQAAEGSKPSLIAGGNAATGTDVFGSLRELSNAQKDPRYTKDPAYRAQVEAKAGRSNI